MQPSSLAKRVPIFLLLALIAFYLYGLGHLPLVGPDEPRYAQVAREMFMRHDFITPTLGGHHWFEKPVMLYWLMMVSYKLLGVTEQAARLGPAISGLLTLLAVFYIGRQVELTAEAQDLKGIGEWSAIIAGTNLGLIVFSRAASFDILITMTMTWALAFFFAYELRPTARHARASLAAFYVFVGLALLAKGLVGLLPFGITACYFLLRREIPRRQFITSILWGLPLALLVAAVWYGPVIARHGWSFIDEFIIQHHFARYLSNKYHHPQPFYFYLLVIVPLTLPWTPFFLHSLANIQNLDWRGENVLDKLRVFCFSWLVVPVAFFSFSGSKLPGYILPVVAAAALLAGERLSRFVSTGLVGRGAMRATGLVCLLFAVGGVVYVRYSGATSLRGALAVVFAAALSGFFILLWTRFRAASAALVACATMLAFVVLLNCSTKVVQRESVKQLIQLADQHGYSDLPICAFYNIDQTAQFYASGRLLYSRTGEPVTLQTPTEISNLARSRRQSILILVPLENLIELRTIKETKVEEIGNNGSYAILVLHL